SPRSVNPGTLFVAPGVLGPPRRRLAAAALPLPPLQDVTALSEEPLEAPAVLPAPVPSAVAADAGRGRLRLRLRERPHGEPGGCIPQPREPGLGNPGPAATGGVGAVRHRRGQPGLRRRAAGSRADRQAALPADLGRDGRARPAADQPCGLRT